MASVTQDTPQSKNRLVLAGKVVFTSITAVVAFAETINTAMSGKVALLFVVVYYAIRTELIVAAVIAFAYPSLRRIVSNGVRAIRASAGADRGRVAAMGMIVILALASLASIVFAAAYVKQKSIFLHHYPNFVLRKGLKEFRRGHVERARMILNAGASVLHDEDCLIEMLALDDNVRVARVLRKIHDGLPPASAFRPRLEVAILGLDRRYNAYLANRMRYRVELAEARRLYRRALVELLEGRTDNARKLLGQVDRAAPGFGWNEALQRESRNPRSATPALDALRRLGPDRFIEVVTAWRDPALLVPRGFDFRYSTDGKPAPEYRTRDILARIAGF